MSAHSAEILRRFEALDRLLQANGFPATSPWWHGTVRRFYQSGRKQLVCRVGRRGGKSSTLCRLAACEGLFGRHQIPPGDVGVVALISTTRDEAAQRIRTIKAILDALGVKYRPVDGGVELADKPIAFKVYTATVSGVSGFTGILVIADECAKWRDVDTNANPASEVLASVRPTMATQPEARIILSSSPFGMWDAHYDAFERGDDDFQVVAHAPSWIANHTLTEAGTRALEPDEAIWSREYKAVPAAEAEEALITAAEIDRATRVGPDVLPPEAGHVYEAACDPGTRGNAFTLAIATMRMTDRGLRRRIVLAKEKRGSTAQPLSPKAVLAEWSADLRAYGIDTLWSDGHSGDALKDIARDLGITLVPVATTQATKLDMYKNLQTLVRTDQVELPPLPQLKQDLLGIRRRFSRAGVSIELVKTPDLRHSDHAASVATVLSKYLPEPLVTRALTDAEREAAAKAHRREEHAREQEAMRRRRRFAPNRDMADTRRRWGIG